MKNECYTHSFAFFIFFSLDCLGIFEPFFVTTFLELIHFFLHSLARKINNKDQTRKIEKIYWNQIRNSKEYNFSEIDKVGNSIKTRISNLHNHYKADMLGIRQKKSSY
jgi:hypothetical protein